MWHRTSCQLPPGRELGADIFQKSGELMPETSTCRGAQVWSREPRSKEEPPRHIGTSPLASEAKKVNDQSLIFLPWRSTSYPQEDQYHCLAQAEGFRCIFTFYSDDWKLVSRMQRSLFRWMWSSITLCKFKQIHDFFLALLSNNCIL